jgi:hypothetical protein
MFNVAIHKLLAQQLKKLLHFVIFLSQRLWLLQAVLHAPHCFHSLKAGYGIINRVLFPNSGCLPTCFLSLEKLGIISLKRFLSPYKLVMLSFQCFLSIESWALCIFNVFFPLASWVCCPFLVFLSPGMLSVMYQFL